MSDAPDFTDHHAINSVLLWYCRAVDRCDRELLTRCFHPDAIDEHGRFVGPRDEFVEFAIDALAERAQTHGQVTTHLISNAIIEVEGDIANVECYVVANHVEDRDDYFRVFEFHGRYLDRFERRSGEWRIARRITVHDWSEFRHTRRALAPGARSYPQGVPSRDDPSYAGA